MENIKKNPLSLQLNADDFLPASNEEKQSLVIMRESVNFWKDGLRRLKKNKIAMVSFVFIIAIAIFAYLLPAVWPYSYAEQVKGSNNLAPFEYSASEQARIDAGEKVFPHILGTDRMGRDFAVRIMMGTRVSLSVGLIASVLVLIIGATYGAVAAFAGGWVDNIMMRIIDVLDSIPMTLYVILIMVVVGPGISSIIIALGLTFWVKMARIVRGQVLTLKQQEFVKAAIVTGADTKRIIVKHLIPNMMGPIMVNMAMQIPSAIFNEAFLSFVGLGISAPMASWGTLCNDALAGIYVYPYQMVYPAIAISVTILTFNLLSDGLRDAFDPKQRK